jgi:hypothetical protein
MASGGVTAPQTRSDMELRKQAEAVRRGLLRGYILVPEAVAWADELIMAAPSPHPALLELSLAGKRRPEHAARELEALTCKLPSIPVEAILDSMRSVLQRDSSRAESIAWALYDLAIDGCLPREMGEAFGLAYEFGEYRTTYLSTEDAILALRQLLGLPTDRPPARFPFSR